MVLPDVPEPGNSIRGVLSLVLLSVLELPRSEPASRSGADGAAGRTDKLPVPEEVAKVPLSVGARLAPMAKVPAVAAVYEYVAIYPETPNR